MNWVLFVPLQIQSSEEGLLYTQDLASTYGHVCCWWVGPRHTVIRIFHPNCIKPVLFAPGRHPPGHSLPIAEVSMLPPTGQVTQVQIEGAVAETPMSLSHLDPHLPHLQSRLLKHRTCLCDIFCMAMPSHIYVSTHALVTAGTCSHLGSNTDGLSCVWGSAVAKDF